MSRNVFRTTFSLILVALMIGAFVTVDTKAAETGKPPIIIKKADVDLQPIAFGGKEGDAGWWSQTNGDDFLVGVALVNPGFAGHAWHVHTFDRKENKGLGVAVEVTYPKKGDVYTFEEFYYLVWGSGVVQWETADGKIEEAPVGPGDLIFYPRGVTKHQFFNNGKEQAFILYGGAPAPEIKVIDLKK